MANPVGVQKRGRRSGEESYKRYVHRVLQQVRRLDAHS
jgi:hypothetical protein